MNSVHKIIIPIHVSKSDCFKYINSGAKCRCVTSTQTGMKELGTNKDEWFGECFWKRLGEWFVHVSGNVCRMFL